MIKYVSQQAHQGLLGLEGHTINSCTKKWKFMP